MIVGYVHLTNQRNRQALRSCGEGSILSGFLADFSADLATREGSPKVSRWGLSNVFVCHCWLAQQWAPGARFALLDEPAVAPVAIYSSILDEVT